MAFPTRLIAISRFSTAAAAPVDANAQFLHLIAVGRTTSERSSRPRFFIPRISRHLHRRDHHRRHSSASSYARILGVETSCDDTGVAILDTEGAILAEALYSQSEFHAQLGGVMPVVARDLHAENLKKATEDVLRASGLALSDLSAIAVTTEPGLIMTLREGLNHARALAIESRLPLFPIHHMQAHALMPRLAYPDLDFPFLTLLVSGGHCILALVYGVDDFRLLGTCADEAPGEVLDKVARRLKLRNLNACRRLSGGRAIEMMADQGDPSRFPFPHVMLQYRDCNFSFSGIHAYALNIIRTEEEHYGVVAGDVLPCVADVAAALQVGIAQHLAMRVVRAWHYCEAKGLFPEGHSRRLVMSGGVAANGFLRTVLGRVCGEYEAELICPPSKFCTDNGIMIAWNAVEKWKNGDRGVDDELEMWKIVPVARSALGIDLGEDVVRTGLSVKSKEIDEFFRWTSTEAVEASRDL